MASGSKEQKEAARLQILFLAMLNPDLKRLKRLEGVGNVGRRFMGRETAVANESQSKPGHVTN